MVVYFYLNRTLRIVWASNCLVKMVIIYALQVLLGYSKPWHHGGKIIFKVAIICCCNIFTRSFFDFPTSHSRADFL